MYYRKEYIRENVAITANDTYRVDLPKQGLLSSILFRLSGTEETGLGQDGGSWRLCDFVSKIQILGGGSYVIKSISGKQLHALGFFDERVMPMDTWRNYATNTQFAYFMLNFGRYNYDPSMGLDLGNWDNVELQFTTTITSTEFSALSLSMHACYLEEAGGRPFSGFMRTEQWRQWTPVQDETKYLIVDTEYKIRRMLIEAIADVDGTTKLSDTGIANLADDIKLSLDTGKIVLWQAGLDDLINDNYYNYGAPIITAGFPYMFADRGVDMGIGYIHGAVAGAGSQDGAVAGTFPTMESGRTDTTQKFEVYTADKPSGLITMGKAPFGHGVFRFDYEYDPATWLDPMQRKQVDLNIHTRNIAAAAGGSLAVLLDRYVPY